MASIGTLTADLRLQSAAFIRDLGRAQAAVAQNTAQMARQMKQVERAANGVDREVRAVRRGLTGFGAAIAALGLGVAVRDIVRTSAEFQRLQASLKTVTGSAANAARSFAIIKDFAASTPFDLQQITAAFIKLKALGLDPSREALESYGNTASAMGKSLNQFVEAVADAITGEFERLKEFGIRAASEGDKVTFTFQGVSTQIGKNASEIEAYLRKLGQVQFSGAMEEQAKTLGGALSNLGDAFSVFQNEIGEGGLSRAVSDLAREFADAAAGSENLARQIGSTLGEGIRLAGEAAKFAAEHMREIGTAIAVLISYKAASVFLAIGAAVVKLAVAVRAATVATGAFNAVIRANPIGLLASAVAIGVGAIIEFGDSKDEATEAAKRHARAVKDETTAIEDQTQSVREGQKVALEQTIALSERRAAAFREIKEMQKAGALGAIDPGDSITTTNGTEISGFELMVKDLSQAIRDEERAAKDARVALDDLAKSAAAAGNAAGDAAKLTKEQAEDLQKLQDRLIPAIKAQREFEEGVKLLDAAVEAGQLSFMDYNLMLETLQMNLDETTKGTVALAKAQKEAADAEQAARTANTDLRNETQAVMNGAKAWEDYKKAREIGQEVAALRKDLEAAKVSAEAVERLTSERRFLLETQQEAIRQLEAEQATYRELQNIGERAFDRIGSSITEMFVQGKSGALEWKNVLLGVISEIAQGFFQLSTINPLKNALFGGSSPTLGGLFGGGGSSGFLPGGTDWLSIIFGGGGGLGGPGIGSTPMAFLADGGSFDVGSNFPSIQAGRDNRLVSFAARDGERVTVETPGQQRMKSGVASVRGGDTYIIDAKDADKEGFARLERMIQSVNGSVERRAISAVADAQRRGRPAMRGAFG